MDVNRVVFWLRDGRRNPVVCFVINHMEKSDQLRTVSYGFAICSPKDQLRKGVGRTIALDRLMMDHTGTYSGDFEAALGPKPLVAEIMKLVLLSFLDKQIVPNRVKQLASAWLSATHVNESEVSVAAN